MDSEGAPPIRVDGYHDFTRIGTGGFSTVYRAEQSRLGRQVAIKVLHADLASVEEQQTFERECRALGLLSRHPNIVTVYHDAVAHDGRRCIVMELYHGTVRELLTHEGRRPVAEVLRLGIRIGSALQMAHDAGILHRDVKPHNILLSDYGEPALGDFGISVIDVERSMSSASGLSLAYASPEALDGRRATRASDIYSLGATMYHLLKGEPPFASTRRETSLARIISEPPPGLDREDVPPSLEQLLLRCLAKSPTDRPESADQIVVALQSIEEETGSARTTVPRRRSAPGASLDVAADDAPTVGGPGAAVAAAAAAAAQEAGGPVTASGPTLGAAADGSPRSDESRRPGSPLWPPGWSPWDRGDEATIERVPAGRSGLPPHGPAPAPAGSPAPAQWWGRRRIGIVLAATLAVVLIGIAVVAVVDAVT